MITKLQQYFTKNRLSVKADAWGFHLLMLSACLLLFLLLWGVRLPAFTAGVSLYLFLITLRRTGREQRLRRRENEVRRRIGGEIALERLLLEESARAHFEAALLLSNRYHFQLVRILDEGVLCKKDGKTLLISFVQMHREDTLSATQTASFHRIACRVHADQCWLCVPCKISPDAREVLGASSVLRLFSRDALIRLFGAAAPATDNQLVLIKRRRKQPMRTKAWRRELLRGENAPRFARYAALMAALLFLTGQSVYGVSATLMMALSSLCHLDALKQKTLPEGSV